MKPQAIRCQNLLYVKWYPSNLQSAKAEFPYPTGLGRGAEVLPMRGHTPCPNRSDYGYIFRLVVHQIKFND
jgi:hypothetical protein